MTESSVPTRATVPEPSAEPETSAAAAAAVDALAAEVLQEDATAEPESALEDPDADALVAGTTSAPELLPAADPGAGAQEARDTGNALHYGPPVTVGRVVHYATGPGAPVHAAIVSRVHNASLVDLHVLVADGHRPVLLAASVSFDGSEEPAAGTWHWPPRA